MLTQEQLKEHVNYNSDTGVFTKVGDSHLADKPLGGITEHGYIRITIGAKKYMAQHLAWLFHYGVWPDGIVNRRNTDRTDNRISNLYISHGSCDKTKTQVTQRLVDRRTRGIVGETTSKVLSSDELKAELQYNPDTGVFTWPFDLNNQKKAGSPAGSLHRTGYIHIGIKQRIYAAHRLAWLYVTGDWPSGSLDHKDGDKSNNRFSNLRLATDKENQLNVGLRADNTSGYPGVTWSARESRWKVRCSVNGVRHYLGGFKDKEDAIATYEAFAKEHHAEFYRPK